MMKSSAEKESHTAEEQLSPEVTRRFFFIATMMTILGAGMAIREELLRRLPSEDHEQQRTKDPELLKISLDIDTALGACNEPANLFCIPTLLCSISKDQPVTLGTLRTIAQTTTPTLSSSACRVLDTVESKPQLLTDTLILVRQKLHRLPPTDWRKIAFKAPLEQCLRETLESRVSASALKKTNLDDPELSLYTRD